MTSSTKKPRKNRAPLNLAMGLVGFASLIALTIASSVGGHSAFTVLSVLVLVASLTTMFFTRNADEYTAQLWVSGANAAFIAMVLWLLVGPFMLGVIDGFNSAHSGTETEEPDLTWVYSGASTFSLFAFYLTFNIKRLTGAF